MNKSEQINELASALAKAQGELESAGKSSRGHGYNYSDLATVISTAKPVLSKHGLSITQLVNESDVDKVSVTTILLHSSGQFIASTGTIKIPEMRGVNDTQKAGAALSYLRRYSLQSILGMASEDNDASSGELPKTNTTNNVDIKFGVVNNNAGKISLNKEVVETVSNTTKEIVKKPSSFSKAKKAVEEDAGGWE
jgi:hypothetical protein